MAGLIAVEVKGDLTFEAGVHKVLFETCVPGLIAYDRNQYAVTKDGQRFLVNRLVEESDSTSITVVLNWTAELQR